MARIVGIDLGTTNSCVAVMELGVPQVIPGRSGNRTTPSVVSFTAQGERLVGGMAKRQVLTNRDTAIAVKRIIGHKFDSAEVARARQSLSSELVRAPNGDTHIKIKDRVYAPAEISAFVLCEIKAAAEDYLGEPVEEAVITVPASYSDPQRQATRDAGLIAGFKAVRLLNDPTAAALAYGLKRSGKRSQFVAVYDLGAGTFDVTILEMADGFFQVRATAGDTQLGGEDFDQRIIDWLIDEFQCATGIDFNQDRMALQRLKEAAEKAKCELSSAQQTEIVLPLISADASGPKHLNTVLTRQKYEELTDELLERTVESCKRCLADAQMKAEQIDEVLLVGGQTRAPKVSELVRRVFGREPNRAMNPDEGVALGAAIQAGIIQSEVKDLVLLDVTPHTLFTWGVDGTVMPLIERNSTIPARTSRVFTTVADNQSRIEVDVLQGAHILDSRSLAKFELTDIPPGPKGAPQIEVGFEIDADGIVLVEATDQLTGRRQPMTIHPAGGLSHADVSRLVAETLERMPEDRRARERIAVSRQLDGLVVNTKRALQALEGTLSADERRRILEAIQEAERARAELGLEEIKKSQIARPPGSAPSVILPPTRGGATLDDLRREAAELGATVRVVDAGALEIEAPAGHHWAPDDPPELTAEHWTRPSRTLFLQSPRPGQVQAAARRLERCTVERGRPACMCAGAYEAPPKLPPGIYIADESVPGRVVAEQWDEKGLVQRVVLKRAAKTVVDPATRRDQTAAGQKDDGT